MEFVLFSACLLLLVSLASYVLKNVKLIASFSVLAALIGLISPVKVLATQIPVTFSLEWIVPYGAFSLKIDPLSAFFLVIILSIAALAAIYSIRYFEKFNPTYWLLFNLLVLSMVLVVTANNTILFLVAWEIMSIASYFLVVFEHEREEVRRAGLIYLFASHICMVLLLILFILIGKNSLDEITLTNPLFFVLALTGFGIKCGLFPFHIWLVEAHPVAPSPISALMSGVMIKLGIYGILRTLTFYVDSPFSIHWGWSLIVIGAISGIFGIILALAQKDLKKMLAYSSVENISIIAIAIGLSLLGIGLHLPFLAVLGLLGALLHVLNHAIFKSLLFLGAGAIQHATNTLNLNSLGGLIKKAPVLGYCFLIGCLSISAIPLFNGFIGEFFIYKAAFHGILNATVKYLIVITAMALISGLTLACFSNCFSMIFLGNPKYATTHKIEKTMLLPLIILAIFCILIPFAFLLLPIFLPIVQQITHLDIKIIEDILYPQIKSLIYILLVSLGFWGLFGSLWWLRSRLYKRVKSLKTVTWDCGYINFSNRMQYTFSSFTQPLVNLFKIFYVQKNDFVETVDPLKKNIYKPGFDLMIKLALKFRWIQEGRLQIYVLYIFLTLITLLIFWKLS